MHFHFHTKTTDNTGLMMMMMKYEERNWQIIASLLDEIEEFPLGLVDAVQLS